MTVVSLSCDLVLTAYEPVQQVPRKAGINEMDVVNALSFEKLGEGDEDLTHANADLEHLSIHDEEQSRQLRTTSEEAPASSSPSPRISISLPTEASD